MKSFGSCRSPVVCKNPKWNAVLARQEIILKELKPILIRHRFTIRDVFMIGGLVALTTLFAWQVDVFPNETEHTHELVLEVDEGLGVLAAGLAVFAWSRLAAQRRESRRRLKAELEARALAFEDPLTGLPNRRQFEEALKAALSTPPGSDGAHAILMIDLNGFKRINDVHGHPVGDEALIQAGSRLRKAVRPGDLVARLGGDEFAILARQVSGPEAATGLALRIIESLAQPVQAGGRLHQLGAGVGLALAPQDGEDQVTLLRKADIALYRAKAEGGSALRFFEPEMDLRIRERDQLERDLRDAIGTSALRPFYQPIVDLGTQQVTAFEAIPRWLHPTLGEMAPERFMSIAEDIGVSLELCDYLLRQACRDAKTWPVGTALSFNIVPAQLKDRTLSTRILKILADEGLAAERLELVITESALVHDLEAAQQVLGGIRDAGVRLAVGDFGTGYSTLYHLRNFKLDKIKIDHSFIESMTHSGESAAIVKALAGLGAGLGLTISAEGVTDLAQQTLLATDGCLEGQGHLYGGAVSPDEARALVRA